MKSEVDVIKISMSNQPLHVVLMWQHLGQAKVDERKMPLQVCFFIHISRRAVTISALPVLTCTCVADKSATQPLIGLKIQSKAHGIASGCLTPC